MGFFVCKGPICILPIKHFFVHGSYSACATQGERPCLAMKKKVMIIIVIIIIIIINIIIIIIIIINMNLIKDVFFVLYWRISAALLQDVNA